MNNQDQLNHRTAKNICSWMLLCLHMLPIVNVPMMCIIYLHCRVESESSGREENAPIIVLFTGISQSVVKNLKQVYNYVHVCISVCIVIHT